MVFLKFVTCIFTILISFSYLPSDNAIKNSVNDNVSEFFISETQYDNKYNFKLYTEEDCSGKLTGFDVSNQNQIALGIDCEKINVYDANGKFCYGISYYTPSGGSSSLLYDKENGNLIIRFEREDELVKLDKKGNVIEIEKYDYSEENRQFLDSFEMVDSFLNHVSKKGTNSNYILHDPGLLGTTLLGKHITVKILFEDGSNLMLYDDNGETARFLRRFFICFILLMIVVLFIWFKFGKVKYKFYSK